jgi:GNAT superfamily N-acetyltransferase
MGATGGDISSAGMAAAIEANIVETSSLFGRVPGTELHDEGPELRFYVTAGVPSPPLQPRLPDEAATGETDARIEAACCHYAARRLPSMWSVGPFSRPPDLGSRLRSHGLVCAERLGGMAADLRTLDEGIPPPYGLTIERVGDDEVLGEYVGVAGAGFGMPGFVTGALFEACSVLGLAEENPFGHYVGRLGGKVLATASLSLAAGVAGIFNVATLPGARRRGIGTALTLAALRDVRERGCRIGILQSSAVGVYRRLGFEQHSTYLVYAGTLQASAASTGRRDGETPCRGASCRSRRRTSGCRGGISGLRGCCSRVRALCCRGPCGCGGGTESTGRRCGGSPAGRRSSCSFCSCGASAGRGGGASAAPPSGRRARTPRPWHHWYRSPADSIVPRTCYG